MVRKILCVLAAAACGLALTGGAALAHGGAPSTIVFRINAVGDGSAACPGFLFGLSFDMQSLGRPSLGSGRSCVSSIVGCENGTPCHDTATTTWFLDLAQGSLTLSVRLDEFWSNDATLFQIGTGRVIGGTGAYAGASGAILGGGPVTFGAAGPNPRLVYAVHVD